LNNEHMHQGSGERGAALLIALLSVMFLTILGLTLFEILRGGMTQAVSSEASVQAEALAQRGIDEATALIREAVAQANDGASNYQSKVNMIQNRITNNIIPFLEANEGTGVSYGKYELEVVSNEKNIDDFNANVLNIPDYPYSSVITIKSTAVVSEHRKLKRTVTKEADIYVSTINPVFRYPVSAVEDISLFGAPYIVGDLLSRKGNGKGNLYVSDKAVFIGSPGMHYRMASTGPTVEGFHKTNAIKAINPSGPDPELDWLDLIYDPNLFIGMEPFLDNEMQDDSDIPVETYVEQAIKNASDSLDGFALIDSGDILGTIDPVIGVNVNTNYYKQWVTFSAGKAPVTISSSLAVTKGALTLEGHTKDDEDNVIVKGADVQMDGGSIYVEYEDINVAAANFGGKLTLDKDQSVVVKGDVVIGDGFDFTGRMYVEGSLKIIGSVNLNGTIFVNGDVEMKEMKSVNAVDESASDPQPPPPLILIASGELIFSDSRPDESTSIIRAFLYSQKEEVNLYGITSRLEIQGGVHGKSVTINAIREQNPPGILTSPEAMNGGTDSFELTPVDQQKGLTPADSNLKVFFDRNLFANPPIGIPITDKDRGFSPDSRTINMFVQSK